MGSRRVSKKGGKGRSVIIGLLLMYPLHELRDEQITGSFVRRGLSFESAHFERFARVCAWFRQNPSCRGHNGYPSLR